MRGAFFAHGRYLLDRRDKKLPDRRPLEAARMLARPMIGLDKTC
jgi:hypothetical protein